MTQAASKTPPRKRSPRKQPAEALSAAGRKIDLSERNELRTSLPNSERWQADAWDALGIGELAYGVDFLGNAISRLRIFPATVPTEPEGVPEASDDTAAIATLDRLRGQRASHAEILRDVSRHLVVVGDCYLVGYDDPDTRVERWEIRSIDEVKKQGGKFILIKEPGKTEGTKLDPEDFVGRIWFPSLRFRERATSPVKGILEAAMLLAIIQRAYRAIVRSRIPAGNILAIPQDHSPGNPDPTTSNAGGGEAKKNPLIAALEEAFITPIGDEGSASALMPLIYFYPRQSPDQTHGIEAIKIERDLDEILPKLEEQQLKRLAQGLNLPVEIISGLGDATHWGSGQIEESVFREHVEPLAILICEALTEAYFRPALVAAGMSPELAATFMVWYDASNLVVNTNRQKVATDGVKIGGIGHSAWRRVSGFSENDAPTEEELAIAAYMISQGRAGGIDGEIPDESNPSTPPAEPGPPRTAPRVASANGNGHSPSAANGHVSVDQLGRYLYELDQSLLLTLRVSAEAAMDRALERAGSRIATIIRRNTQLTQMLVDVPKREAAATLGPNVLSGLGVTPAQLLKDAFTEHVREFQKRCKTTASTALSAAPILTYDLHYAKLEDQILVAAERYSDKLYEVAEYLLFTPNPPTLVGEHDDCRIQLQVIREAMDFAGGAQIGDLRLGLGIACGPVIEDAFATAGIRRSSFIWTYGSVIRHPDPTHASCDGDLFDLDTALTSPHPCDTPGCFCALMPIFEQVPLVDTSS